MGMFPIRAWLVLFRRYRKNPTMETWAAIAEVVLKAMARGALSHGPNGLILTIPFWVEAQWTWIVYVDYGIVSRYFEELAWYNKHPTFHANNRAFRYASYWFAKIMERDGKPDRAKEIRDNLR